MSVTEKFNSLAKLLAKRGFMKAANICNKIIIATEPSESEKLRHLLERARTPQERRDALLTLDKAKVEDAARKERERLKELDNQKRRLREYRRDNPTVQETRVKPKITPGLSPDREYDMIEESVEKDNNKPKMGPTHSPSPKPVRPGSFVGHGVTSWKYTPFFIKLDAPLPDGRTGFMGKRKSLVYDWVWDGKKWITGAEWDGAKPTEAKIFDGKDWIPEKEFLRSQRLNTNKTVEELEKSGKYPEIKMIRLIAKTNFDDIREAIRALPFSIVSLSQKTEKIEDMNFSYLQGKVLNKSKPMDEKSALLFLEKAKSDKAFAALFIADRTGRVISVFPEENAFLLKDFFNQKITVEYDESEKQDDIVEESLSEIEPENRGKGGVNIF